MRNAIDQYQYLLKSSPPDDDIVHGACGAPLLQFYLKCGAQVCGEPALDKACKCIDYLTILDKEQMDAGAKRKYGS